MTYYNTIGVFTQPAPVAAIKVFEVSWNTVTKIYRIKGFSIIY
jgi:hypothetical protein